MSETQKQAIGARLSQERNRFGWSQTEAAGKAGVGFSTYAAYEQGRSTPNAEALQQLAGRGVDVLYVITGQATNDLLTPDEMMVLNYWRDSPDELRAAWLGFYRAYASAIRHEGG